MCHLAYKLSPFIKSKFMSLANMFTGSTNGTSVVLVCKLSKLFLGHVLMDDERCDTNLERYLLETKPSIKR